MTLAVPPKRRIGYGSLPETSLRSRTTGKVQSWILKNTFLFIARCSRYRDKLDQRLGRWQRLHRGRIRPDERRVQSNSYFSSRGRVKCQLLDFNTFSIDCAANSLNRDSIIVLGIDERSPRFVTARILIIDRHVSSQTNKKLTSSRRAQPG